MAYPMPLLYDDERQNQRDYEYMKSVYPGTAKRLIPYIEEECDRLEYTGSVMYDEYPDRLQLLLLCRRIYNRAKEDEAKEIMIGEDFLGSEDEPMFCGEAVKEVYLPPDTVEIGKYAFYGCVNLTTLGFSDSLLRTGAGIFTGCKLQKIYYDVYEDKKSALRDVVRDTRFPLQVNIRYKEEEKQSRLFYPEYYEEAVENTPARIVETHFHGTGYQYRQSFLRGEIDYRKYDDIFPVAAVQEDLDIVWEILAGRMLMPYGVSDFAWMQYEGYVKQNQCEMMNYLKEEDQMPFINLMAEKNYFSKEGIEAAIDWASRKQKTELLSIFDERTA